MSRSGALYVISAIDTGGRLAVAPGRLHGVPLLTGPPLRAVPAGACSRGCGGCWPRCPAATVALTAEPAGTVPGSARRRSRTEHPPAGHATSRRRRQRAPLGERPCRGCHRQRQPTVS